MGETARGRMGDGANGREGESAYRRTGEGALLCSSEAAAHNSLGRSPRNTVRNDLALKARKR